MGEIDPFDKEGAMAGGEIGWNSTEVAPACEGCGTRDKDRKLIKGFWLCPCCSDGEPSSLSTADHAQLSENLVDSQSDSATNSKEKGR